MIIKSIPNLSASDIKRFHSKVAPPNERGCRLWVGRVCDSGYGSLKLGSINYKAHRISAVLSGNTPTESQPCVLHKCDTPACVEPSHLFLGTHIDNVADRVMKNRTARGATSGMKLHPEAILRGEQSPSAKFTEADILKIRADNRPHRKIAQDYGVDHSTIGHIIRRQTWAHVE